MQGFQVVSRQSQSLSQGNLQGALKGFFRGAVERRDIDMFYRWFACMDVVGFKPTQIRGLEALEGSGRGRIGIGYGVRAGCEWVHTQISRGQWEVQMQWIVVRNGKRNPSDSFTETECCASDTHLHSVSLVYV